MSGASPGQQGELMIAVAGAELPGTLAVPEGAAGVVLFAHGSGSGRHSPRNQMVARWLRERRCGTLLLDLLTPREAGDRRNVFDVPLLARRVRCATASLRAHAQAAGLEVGYFGASTGAGAALVAAAEEGDAVAAVVSRGGRPDLAGDALPRVLAPTLLIVGSLDAQVLALNRQARSRLRCESELEVVEGASHLFEEPGALEEVGRLAGGWFARWFRVRAPRED